MKKYVRTPTIYQMEATECGAASLSMIFAYFGKHIPLEQMRVETGVSRDGCNAGNIMRAAKKYGLDCHGYRKEPSGLKKLKPPCIIHWNFNHFVVFEGFRGKKPVINDPALGRRVLTPEEFDDSFTGVVLTFSPTGEFKKEKKKSVMGKTISQRLSGQYSTVLQILFVGLLLLFPGIALPMLGQVMLDDVIIGGNYTFFWQILIAMGTIILLQAGLTLYRSRVLLKLQKKMALVSSRKFLYSIFKLPISFFDQRYAGDIVDRVSDNTEVNDFLAGDLAETVLNVIMIAFYFAMLVVYSPLLAAVALASTLINLIVMRVTSNKLSEMMIKQRQDSGKLSGAVCAGLEITSTIKASGAESNYIERILGYNAKSVYLEQRLTRYQQIANAIPSAINIAADTAILLVGGCLVINGSLSIGRLVAFTTMFSSFSEPVESMIGIVKSFQTIKANMARVEDIEKYPSDERFLNTPTAGAMSTKLNGTVELRDISFGYSPLNPPMVKNFCCKVECGKTIAFVGASGCGKSTISKIVSGLYTPWSGQVLFDGTASNEIPTEVINASISTVSQNITLFSGTIRDNLTLWNNNIPDADIISAAKDACIHDLITQKPGAYDYRLTEGAANMSGGQRQRLEIARALVLNPSVLIMDEATSALDPIVEKQIIDNIKRRGCTCIMVAHRLSAIRDCDQIYVMSDGEIVQSGTHDELSREEGLYREYMSDSAESREVYT